MSLQKSLITLDDMVIRLVSEGCYKPKPEDSYLYAMQLFVEKLVLPDSVSSYTVEEMEGHIREFINSLYTVEI